MIQKKSESKLLDRSYVEYPIEGVAGKLSRKDAVAMLAKEVGAPPENIGLIRLEEQSGTTTVLGKFYVYGSQDSKKRYHPKHLESRLLTKEEREKLKQAAKKKKQEAAPAPAPEKKK